MVTGGKGNRMSMGKKRYEYVKIDDQEMLGGYQC